MSRAALLMMSVTMFVLCLSNAFMVFEVAILETRTSFIEHWISGLIVEASTNLPHAGWKVYNDTSILPQR